MKVSNEGLVDMWLSVECVDKDMLNYLNKNGWVWEFVEKRFYSFLCIFYYSYGECIVFFFFKI